MAWDPTIPADTDPIRQGAGVIRQFKSDIATALTVEGIFPGATPASPVFRWKPRYGDTASRPAVDPVNPGSIYVNTTTGTIQRDNGTTWDDVTYNSSGNPTIPSRGQQIFTANGNFTVPAGITTIMYQIWGGGGGSKSTNGGGGGGAGHSRGALTVTPAQVLTVVVGAAGTGGSSPTDGGASSFNGSTIVANGGKASSAGAGGAGGTASGGDINISGMAGGTPLSNVTPGSGGGSPMGGPTNSGDGGTAGLTPGAGGSGPAAGGLPGTNAGAAGGAGLVIVSW